MTIKFTPNQRCSSAVWFSSLYTNILGNILHGKWSSYPPDILTYPLSYPSNPLKSFSHIFLPDFCYTESKLFYIKYRLLWSQRCLCCNFFYGHPEFANFLLNYYKKSSIDNTLHLKFKKKTEISMYTACVFRLSFRSLWLKCNIKLKYYM